MSSKMCLAKDSASYSMVNGTSVLLDSSTIFLIYLYNYKYLLGLDKSAVLKSREVIAFS